MWEYSFREFTGTLYDALALCTEQGTEGWQCFQILGNASFDQKATLVLCFRRRSDIEHPMPIIQPPRSN